MDQINKAQNLPVIGGVPNDNEDGLVDIGSLPETGFRFEDAPK